ncbi:MAG: FecR domain-containing protein [Chitinophagaceae bacterium]|nr:FecR domain-containing protein [Chitinophagaceae bacterium]
MSSNPIRLQWLLHKYIHNTATRAELEEFWRLMGELSDNDLVQLDLKDHWNDTGIAGPGTEVDWNKAYQVLQQKIDAGEVDYTRRVQSVRRKQQIYWGIAASLIMGVAVSLWWLSNNKPELTDQPETVVASATPVYKSGRQTILLPDGTRVTLNENSKLDYSSGFNQSSRNVYLTGEAFFDVMHDAQKPFFVHTGKLVTRVLGTAFNIRAYPGDAAVAVTVTRGKVQVQSDSTMKTLGVLSAGDQLIVDKHSSATQYSRVDVEKVLEWNAGNMMFNNAALEEVAIALSNRFNVSFHFQHEELRQCRFTADFSNESLEQSLEVICTLIHASWEKGQGDNTIWILGEGCE